MKIPNEQKLLVLAANLDPDEDDPVEIRRTMSTISDVNYLIELAVQEGMAGFLYKSLLKADLLGNLYTEQKQNLSDNYYLTIRRNLKLIHSLNEILDKLGQKRIRIILMQGISLLRQV